MNRNLYGSSMLGQEMIGEVIASTDVGEININTETQSVIGDKRYYGNNHLGNNSVTFTDRKIPESDGQGGIDYSLANITYFAEYYPYGMILRDGGDIAAYTFQGQEVDNDVKGKGNSVNYKYRMHDPRVGRFFAVDPLTGKYPHYTPYSFSGNEVIHAVELEGLEEKVVIISDYYEGGKMVITRANFATTKEFVEERDRWSKAYINYDESWKENGNQEAFKMLYNGSKFKHNGTLTINLNSGSEGASYEPRPDNYFGSHYIGPNNPKDNFQNAYYNVYPQGVMDAAARVHNQEYDEVDAAGIWGVVSERTLEADIKLVRTSNKVLEMYNNGETDPFTGEKITSETADRAKAVVAAFSTVIIRKGLDHTNINLEKGQKLVDLLNDVEDIDINEATKRSDFD